MNKDRAKELLSLIEAFANGDGVQYLDPLEEWCDDDDFDPFEHNYLDYRIKPKAREFWLCWEDDEPGSNDYYTYPVSKYPNEFLIDHWSHYVKVQEVL